MKRQKGCKGHNRWSKVVGRVKMLMVKTVEYSLFLKTLTTLKSLKECEAFVAIFFAGAKS
jgi:hypothetical protein